jgi:hypothetical protein
VNNKSLETLLNLDGIVIEQAGGHWAKFEVHEVPETEQIPHGIRYSLTLHEPNGKRIMGFDNAHAVKRNKKWQHVSTRTFDHYHRHSQDKGVAYLFINAEQLLKDFWLMVDKILNSLGFEQEK